MRRTLPEVFDLEGSKPLPYSVNEVIGVLEPLITEARRARMQAVIQQRTRHVVPVLDNIADPHNVSAILRTADGLGIQEVHMTESFERGFAASHRVTRGAEKWLTLVEYTDPEKSIRAMQAQGYVVATAVMDGEYDLEGLNRFPKIMPVFGNEHKGVRKIIRDVADCTFCIPMSGFVESFNVSVAVGITLYVLTRSRRVAMASDEQRQLYAQLLMQTVHDAKAVLDREVPLRAGATL